MKTLVSVIMNCYNGEKYLKKSIDSVINQDYKNWELIFYDNTSTDSSRDIFFNYKKFDKRFKYFKSKKKEKLGLARSNALKKIKGKIEIKVLNRLFESIGNKGLLPQENPTF
jgi:glycosyltransferase involved in cell wall biosynthesis